MELYIVHIIRLRCRVSLAMSILIRENISHDIKCTVENYTFH